MYGAAVHGESWGHTRRYGYQASLRFAAERTGTLSAVVWQVRVLTCGEWDSTYKWPSCSPTYSADCKMERMYIGGYHWGDGGLLQVTVQSDDGAGHPSGHVLATGTRTIRPVGSNPRVVGTRAGVTYYCANSFDAHPEVTLDHPLAVTAGQRYHLVITQRSPSTGLTVVNGSFTTASLSPPGGPYYGSRLQVMYRHAAGEGWTTREQESGNTVLPDYALRYTDGTLDGTGYAGVNGSGAKLIGGANRVRQVIRVRDASRTVRGVWLRAGRSSGSGALIATIKDASGAHLLEASVAASRLGQVSSFYQTDAGGARIAVPWVYADFGGTALLRAGSRYTLELSSSSGSYFIGTDEVNITTRSVVWSDAESRAEYSRDGGSSWNVWDRDRDDGSHAQIPAADLTALFTLAGEVTERP